MLDGTGSISFALATPSGSAKIRYGFWNPAAIGSQGTLGMNTLGDLTIADRRDDAA